MAHAYRFHPDHRQGDIVLADGARLFTCTKNVIDGSRTPMLLVEGLFRLDVEGSGDDVRLFLRNISGAQLSGGPEAATHRRTRSFSGVEQVVTEFPIVPSGGPVGEVRVSITRPAADRGERFPCTAIAIVTRRAS